MRSLGDVVCVRVCSIEHTHSMSYSKLRDGVLDAWSKR